MVRIIKQPVGQVDGISLRLYHPGKTYDVPATLADYLVMQGYATIEMRKRTRSHRPRPTDRRGRK